MASQNPDTDSALVLLLLEGQADNPKVLKRIIQRFSPEVHRFALDILNGLPESHAPALQLTTKTFQEALQNPERVQEFEDIQTWLFSHTLLLAPNHPPAKNTRAAARSRPGWEALSPVDTLPMRERLTVILRYHHHLPSQQIAQIFRTPEGKVHKILSHARLKLLYPEKRPPSHKIHRQQQLHRVLDGGVEIEPSLREHLKECLDCQDFLQRDLKLAQAFRAESQQKASLDEGDIQEIIQAISSAENGRPNKRLPLPIKEIALIGLAAVLFLAAARMLNPYFSTLPPTPTPSPTATPIPLITLPAQNTTFDPYTSASLPPARHLMWRWDHTSHSDYPPGQTQTVFAESGSFAAFGSGKDVILWDLSGTGQQYALQHHQQNLSAIALSPGNQWLASGDAGGSVAVWDIPREEVVFELPAHPKRVSSAVFSPDGSLLAVGHGQGVWVWEMNGKSLIRIRDFPGLPIRSLAFSTDGEILAAGDANGGITIWSIPANKTLLRFQAHDGAVTHLVYAPNGRRLYSGSQDKRLKAFGITATPAGSLVGTLIFTLDAGRPVTGLALDPQGEILANASGLPDLYLWNPALGLPSEIRLGENLPDDILEPAFLKDGKFLAAFSKKGVLYWFVLEDVGEFVQNVPAPREFQRTPANLIPREVRAFEWHGIPQDFFSNLVEEAGLQAGFEINLPDFVSARYTLRGAAYLPDPGMTVLSYTYFPPLGPREMNIYIYQQPANTANQQPYFLPSGAILGREIGASAPVEAVQVDGSLAEFVQGSWEINSRDNPGFDFGTLLLGGTFSYWLRWNPASGVQLRWQEGGVQYTIQAFPFNYAGQPPRFGRGELKFLAESMMPPKQNVTLLTHIVEEGETCTGLAARYGTTVGTIMRVNDLKDCDLILVGQSLQIPLTRIREPFAETDLNCDGQPERISTIPDPLQTNPGTNFGVVVETIPAGLDPDNAEFWPVWEMNIAQLPVDFFTAPEIFSTGDCEKLLALNAFGGNSGFSGLDVYRWDGENMQLVLNARGFSDGKITDQEHLPGPYTVTTHSLEYDENGASCNQINTVYQWEGQAFKYVSHEILENVPCFANAP